ncbi:MAG TPA: hypothetical protein VG076_05110 [Acidimicrobiales bacterium]|jgi:hypothetical protein|nr:hypothetical protein [Acidimicrobiales bacterium]
MSVAAPQFLVRRRLIAVAVALPVVETAILWAVGMETALGIAPQASGPAPFDVFHDLRWLLVYHRSWVGLILEAAAFVVFRTAVTVFMVRAAWPEGEELPPLRRTVTGSAAFVVTAAILLSPWVALLFGMAVVSISWLFFVAVPGALAVMVLMHHGAVERGWWRHMPPLRTVGWVGLSFVVLSVEGALLSVSPPLFRLPIAAIAGLFNAWAWFGIVHAVADRPTPRFIPAPAGLVAVILVVVGGAAIGFETVTSRARLSHAAHVETVKKPESGKPVLIVSGFGTHWDGDESRRLPGAFDERRFSYKGLSADGRAMPYGENDTHRSLVDLVRAMGAQVDAFHAATNRPVSIVAESEGSLVAKTYLAATPTAPVNELVMLSPLVSPARVYYPPDGHEGWGVAAGVELKGLTAGLKVISPIDLTPDTPLLRSIADNAPAVRDLLTCPLAGVDQLALFPLADAVASPHPTAVGIPASVVPAFHGGLLSSGAVHKTIALRLDGGKLPQYDVWSSVERVVQVASSAWQVPPLPLSLNPAWGHPPGRSPSCASMAAVLQRWVGGSAPG